MTKVLKISREHLVQILDEYRVPSTSSYFSGSFYERIGSGKVCFSIKVRKRRKLVSGRVDFLGHEASRDSSGYNIYRFIPNNNQRLIHLLIDMS